MHLVLLYRQIGKMHIFLLAVNLRRLVSQFDHVYSSQSSRLTTI